MLLLWRKGDSVCVVGKIVLTLQFGSLFVRKRNKSMNSFIPDTVSIDENARRQLNALVKHKLHFLILVGGGSCL